MTRKVKLYGKINHIHAPRFRTHLSFYSGHPLVSTCVSYYTDTKVLKKKNLEFEHIQFKLEFNIYNAKKKNRIKQNYDMTLYDSRYARVE